MTEEWIYQGRRWTEREGQVWSRWELPDGSILHYGDVPPSPVVGGVYELSPTREDGSTRVAIKSARWLPQSASVPDDAVRQWRMEDHAAAQRLQEVRAAKRLVKEQRDIGGYTLAELQEIMGKQPRHIRRGTLAVVIDYLTGGFRA